jgi:hypothetical protein
MVARMPRITTTMVNSTREKPEELVFVFIILEG